MQLIVVDTLRIEMDACHHNERKSGSDSYDQNLVTIGHHAAES